MEGLETKSREDAAKKVIDFIRRSDAATLFQNVLAGQEAQPPFEQFRDYLTRINGIARQVPIHRRDRKGQFFCLNLVSGAGCT